jgi:pyruvate dehydrogenase E1 component
MINERCDNDPIETQEWLLALSSLIKAEGKERAQFILQQLLKEAKKQGVDNIIPELFSPYCNTIAPNEQPPYPGDLKIEAALEAAIRWNAIAMVMKAKREIGGVGGHLSSFASIATLYEVGMNHFFKGDTQHSLGDLVYFQGHSSEGNYARGYLEGRVSEQELNKFRQETRGQKGLSSYPHPWLMPKFWQFATVSLGLGMLQGVYQARFLNYLDQRGLLKDTQRKIWVFCGDGEMDEPESIAGLTLAAREKLDRLIFVVNCNLQRLDGLVRGNSKIVQELESLFNGAGWHVIKVLWGSPWDSLFAKDVTGALLRRLGECVDGDMQTAYVRGGAYIREFLFNTDELKALVADWSDDELCQLTRGAHDPLKIYAAYHRAVMNKDKPTVILAQGIKGYGLGTASTEGRNVAHNQLDLPIEELKSFRDRFKLPLLDEQLEALAFYKPDENSPELQYLMAQRQKLGGYLPSRQVLSQPLLVPDLSAFNAILQGSADRTMSTTMVLGRILNVVLKDKNLGSRVVPIFSDEVRTFGLEALFRQVGIYSPSGQLYTPEDKEQFLYYHETQTGQVLEEGITEAGCLCSWIAAATSYATNRFPMIPFFTYYSMFGFQRVGDLIWAAADMRARGFLIGATAGRTTLEGEGLQHQDGASVLTASTIPNCRAYDPAFGYEMAVIIHHGLKEMFHEEKDVFYYMTAMNERYIQPAMPSEVEEGIIKGMYLLYDRSHSRNAKYPVQLLGSGAILNEVIAASELLKKDFNIFADVWSVTSFSELRREAAAIFRMNKLHPKQSPESSYLQRCLENRIGPLIAATDYVAAYPDLIRPYVRGTYYTLGTDGFGRSDTREYLRGFFEVDRYHIAITALYALMQDGHLATSDVIAAMTKYGIDIKKPQPTTV